MSENIRLINQIAQGIPSKFGRRSGKEEESRRRRQYRGLGNHEETQSGKGASRTDNILTFPGPTHVYYPVRRNELIPANMR